MVGEQDTNVDRRGDGNLQEEERDLEWCQCMMVRAGDQTQVDQTWVDFDVEPEERDTERKGSRARRPKEDMGARRKGKKVRTDVNT